MTPRGDRFMIQGFSLGGVLVDIFPYFFRVSCHVRLRREKDKH